jgi:hypothetical protein
MGFSLSSVVLSYFLVAGGTFFSALLAGKLGIHSEYLGYLIMAAGAFLGGLIAARASRGKTIVEPAIGAATMVLSIVVLGLAVSNSAGRDAILLPGNMKGLMLTAGASALGGIAGAAASEKIFGEATTSSVPWILYVSLASFGAGVMGSIFGGVLGHGDAGPLFGILALCSLIVGVATGASARTRPLGASFLGGALGVGGFFFLAILLFVSVFSSGRHGSTDIPSEVYTGIAVLAVGAGIVTLIGSLIGWATVGKKQAT